MVQIYKKGQGKYTRMGTLAGVMLLGVIVAVALSRFLSGYVLTSAPLVRYGISTALIVVLGLLMLFLINRPKTADFLIATESEMKKVSWSSRKEVIGSTKVVIITTFVLAVILFVVDLAFVFLFHKIGVTG